MYYIFLVGITWAIGMTTTMTVKGQVTIPKHVREAAGIRPGDRVDVDVAPHGEVLIRRNHDRPHAGALAAAHARLDVALAFARTAGVNQTARSDDIMRLLRDDV
jgi:antitoxin PrlF